MLRIVRVYSIALFSMTILVYVHLVQALATKTKTVGKGVTAIKVSVLLTLATVGAMMEQIAEKVVVVMMADASLANRSLAAAQNAITLADALVSIILAKKNPLDVMGHATAPTIAAMAAAVSKGSAFPAKL